MTQTISKAQGFYSPVHQRHAPTFEHLHGHKLPFFEKPARVENIRHRLEAAGLLQFETPPLLLRPEVIAHSHAADMVRYLEDLSARVQQVIRDDFAIYEMQGQLAGDEYYYETVFPPRIKYSDYRPDERRFYIYDTTSPVGAGTWDAILHSANLAYVGAQALLQGAASAYALCRPPGHHAGRVFIGGYCYFNNAAIAAHYLKAQGEKVAILDIDYHHGNGTQDIFWDDPEVLFVSLHADPLQDYPYYTGFADERGGPAAAGTTLNLPLPFGTTSVEYLAALETAIETILGFGTSALVVSLGFDTFKQDPIAHFLLEVESYTQVGSRIRALNLPTLYVQEGGYAIDALGDMALAFWQGVVGHS